MSPVTLAPPCAATPRRKLFTGTASLKRVIEELMGYSDYSLHAFCYNSGAMFTEYRLSSAQLLASTKFKFLAELLPKLKVGGEGGARHSGSWLAGQVAESK
jgi:hypothetical protein